MTRCFRFALAMLAIVATSPIALAEDTPAGDQPLVEIHLRKKEDTAKLGGGRKQAVLDIACPSGIGGATLTRTGDRWPEGIALRLHLSGLESLNISVGKHRWSAQVQSHGQRAQLLSLVDDGKEAPIGKSSPDWQEIRILDGTFELSVPASLLKDQPKSISISWIDFYRG